MQESIQTSAQSLHNSQSKVEQLTAELEDARETLEKEKKHSNEQIAGLHEENAKIKKEFLGNL